ncbi:MAG: acetyl-CoA carboxylase biotin carboxyl carrier protein [Minwuia sp.]|uniref:acetyl-CoA carboxylase biotin carboxyl carrier protein n=1 Tax=Minwuia sp. TaxID=2493630 RepID=UPI003A89FA09
MSKLNVDMKALAQMAALLNEAGLTEIEWEEGDVKVRLGKQAPQMVTAAQVAAPVAAPAAPLPAAASDAAAAGPDMKGTPVTSPMVGTAYLSPEPGAAAFVKVGDTVTVGQTLLIVEAMKTMNPVPSPVAGRVAAILVENEQPVEFEQTLIVIE